MSALWPNGTSVIEFEGQLCTRCLLGALFGVNSPPLRRIAEGDSAASLSILNSTDVFSHGSTVAPGMAIFCVRSEISQ